MFDTLVDAPKCTGFSGFVSKENTTARNIYQQGECPHNSDTGSFMRPRIKTNKHTGRRSDASATTK